MVRERVNGRPTMRPNDKGIVDEPKPTHGFKMQIGILVYKDTMSTLTMSSYSYR